MGRLPRKVEIWHCGTERKLSWTRLVGPLRLEDWTKPGAAVITCTPGPSLSSVHGQEGQAFCRKLVQNHPNFNPLSQKLSPLQKSIERHSSSTNESPVIWPNENYVAKLDRIYSSFVHIDASKKLKADVMVCQKTVFKKSSHTIEFVIVFIFLRSFLE